ncbi:MAG: gamma-glutamyl-gamma-aminobutyrate hydrolase family protein [Anaerolineae bacterium]
MRQQERDAAAGPRIVVSHGRLTADPAATAAPAGDDPYLAALTAAGAVPVLAPRSLSEAGSADLLANAAGLLLCGGADVDPRRYGQPVTHAVSPDARRDERELHLIHAALARDLPLLAICRGIQMLNVALSGTLHQDIAAELPGSLAHRYVEGTDKAAPVHRVVVAARSALAGVLECPEPEVNSRHHQSVRDVAPGLAVVARSPDGVIEALEMPGRAFFIGVQWHPEDMVASQAHAARLFRAFVAAASPSGGLQ